MPVALCLERFSAERVLSYRSIALSGVIDPIQTSSVDFQVGPRVESDSPLSGFHDATR